MRRPTTIIFGGLLALLTVLAFGVWASRVYSASKEAREALEEADVVNGAWYAFGVDAYRASNVGIVLYPGGRVSAAAYAFIARRLAEQSGALVAVVRPPLNLPILHKDAAADVIEAYPDMTRWIAGGHSLGGVMAASFAKIEPRVAGLLLWASYPSGSVDLSSKEVEAVSIRGSQDGLLDIRSFEKARARLPASTVYVEVEGATHAYFGDYGAQSGDGEPTIPREEARVAILSASTDLVDRVRQAGSRTLQ